MSAELIIREPSTPPSLIIQGIRFVFYFVPQPVVETFDNIPQFYLDIVEKKAQDNIRRLYICCKFSPSFKLDPEKDLAEVSGEITDGFNAYLKKHFTSKFSIINTLIPLDVGLVIFHLLEQRKLLEEDKITDYFVATKNPNGHSLVKVEPALLSEFTFLFSSGDTDLQEEDVLCSGNAVLFGEPVIFVVVDKRNERFRAFTHDELLPFVSPALIEETINRTIRLAMGHPKNTNDSYLFDVEIEPRKIPRV